MVCGKILLNLAVLVRRLRNLFPEASIGNSPWLGWGVSLLMSWALPSQCFGFFAMIWMGGSDVPLTSTTFLATLCRDFQSEALQAPDQIEMQLVIMLSIVPLCVGASLWVWGCSLLERLFVCLFVCWQTRRHQPSLSLLACVCMCVQWDIWKWQTSQTLHQGERSSV